VSAGTESTEPSASILISESVGSRLTKTGGRTTGFDYIRIILASCVILAHSRAVTLGERHHTFLPKGALLPTGGIAALPHPPLGQPIVWMIIPSFFALSGFLVAGSLMRSRTTAEFVLLRGLRIVPALFVETILAAFILGPLVTEYSLSDYFSNSEFWQYPLNIVGNIHYLLPGVFVHNPWPRIVNAQLWTIPSELLCYLTLIVISAFGLARKQSAVPIATAIFFAALLVLMFFSSYGPTRWSSGGTAPGPATLLLSFLVGVTIYAYREFVPLHWSLLLVSAVLSYALLWDGAFQYLATIPIAYATVYLGLTDFRKTIINATGDYSYGVYLYGFPVQQLIAYLFPQNQFFLLNFIGGLLVSAAFAALSWHFVESQVLAHRKQIIANVDQFLRRLTSLVTKAA
jgi:peptidoglycan/LPS O-acetylase OafA/YrhL